MIDRPALRYRIAWRLLSPVILAHLLWRAWKDGGLCYVKERLGFIKPISAHRWIHCASVGEVQTVLPLLDELIEREPGTILLTTNTPTGKKLLSAQNSGAVEHRYLPLDFEGAVQRFLGRSQITTGWIMETEIWPSLFAACKRQALPLTIINARVSEKSRDPSNEFVRMLYVKALESVDVKARSDDEANAYIRLGAQAERVTVAGNLKFSRRRESAGKHRNLASTASLITRPYCIAASTHADEERQIALAWLAAGEQFLLVIAPRHPERGISLQHELTQLPEKPSIALRSKGQSPSIDDRLYLADTIGELQAWYAHATAVFVGGSLIKRGGQNMLEPVREGRPVVVGPHTDNFPDIMAELRQARAIHETDTAEGVVAFMKAACRGDAETAGLSRRALDVATQLDTNHIVTTYLKQLI